MPQPAWVNDPAVDWLLAHPSPAVRYRAKVWLLGLDPSSGAAAAERATLRLDPDVRSLLGEQRADGSWAGPALYVPKHRSTFHVLAVLAEFGLDHAFPEVAGGAEYAFRFQARNGEFYSGRQARGGRPSSQAPIPCLTARIAAYLAQLGYSGDTRLALAVEHLISTQRTDGSWSCEARAIPRDHVSDKGCLGAACCFLALVENAPSLLAGHPSARAAAGFIEGLYLRDPKGYHVGNTWDRLPHPYFPMDLADTGRHLVAHLGCTPRVEEGLDLCRAKRRPDGLWAADGHPYRPAVRPTRRDQPSPWVTLRALRFLKAGGTVAKEGASARGQPLR